MLGDNSEATVWGWKEGSRTHQSFIYSIYSRALGAVPGVFWLPEEGSRDLAGAAGKGKCPPLGLSRHSALFCPGQGHNSPPKAQALWNVCLQLLLAGLADGGCQRDEPLEARLVLA